MARRITHEEYINWVKENRPDYVVIGQYVNTSVKILHKHVDSGLSWSVSPGKFRIGISHPNLSRNYNSNIHITHDMYVLWVKTNRPDYDVVGHYVNTKTKIIHKHTSGVEWNVSPEKFKRGHSPTELTICPRWTETDYVNYLVDNNIPVSLVGSFKNKTNPILHRCDITGRIFRVAPNTVIRNVNYKFVYKISDTNSYKNWLSLNRQGLVITEPYVNSQIKINHLHVDTGNCWMVKPNNVVSGNQYPPFLSLNGSSRKSVNWLNTIDGDIHHSMNGGEVSLDGIGKVDGFNEDTNTVYEFHGDFWHGNVEIFDPIDINPISKKSFGFLYNRTLERDATIRSLGYNLVVMWENDFNEKQYKDVKK